MDDIHFSAFYSRKFKSAKMNYSVTDKETLAVIDGLLHFQLQLSGMKFTILTDHMVGLAFTNKILPDDKHGRWLETFNTFDCKIKLLKGTRNVLSNALSRYCKKPEELPQLIKPYPNLNQQDKTNNHHNLPLSTALYLPQTPLFHKTCLLTNHQLLLALQLSPPDPRALRHHRASSI